MEFTTISLTKLWLTTIISPLFFIAGQASDKLPSDKISIKIISLCLFVLQINNFIFKCCFEIKCDLKNIYNWMPLHSPIQWYYLN